jgi:phenylacetate-coenzyme A ligase PaaK-like adenylate-forming protein
MTATSAVPEVTHRLEEVIATAWRCEFYRRHWGLGHWEDVLGLFRAGKFHELPVIRKQDLRDHLDDIIDFSGAVDVVSSSGTTGRPVDLPVHATDDQSRVLRVRRVLRELGLAPGGLVLQLLSLNDLFTLGPLAWQAARAEGCCVLRCSPQRVERVIQVCRQMHPDTVMGNAAVLVRMAQEAAGAWPRPDILPSRGFLGVAATFDAELRPTPAASEAARLWGITLILNHYGCSELGPVAYECRHHQGLHIHDDHHLVELIDPATGLPVSGPDQPGEIVATALTTPRGFLPVRYATGASPRGCDAGGASAGECRRASGRSSAASIISSRSMARPSIPTCCSTSPTGAALCAGQRSASPTTRSPASLCGCCWFPPRRQILPQFSTTSAATSKPTSPSVQRSRSLATLSLTPARRQPPRAGTW